MPTKKPDADHRYGIGAVARLTGLTDHTIRVWERRYQAVVAERAANGRRRYSADDVEKLGLLKRLTDDGVSISQIANDSVDELRARARDIAGLADASVAEPVSIAVLGDYFPGLLQSSPIDLAPVDVLIAEPNPDRFAADLSHYAPDVVVLEAPVLDRAAIRQLTGLMRSCGASGGVMVYNFAATRDVDRARDAHLAVMRAPANVDQLKLAVLGAAAQKRAVRKRRQVPGAQPAPPEWPFSSTVPARRFSQSQLARLAAASTAIDCECPHHLAELVSDLSAFEIYSANCASRNDDDAALHRYLHQTTAQARALIEVALQKVAEAEGLDY